MIPGCGNQLQNLKGGFPYGGCCEWVRLRQVCQDRRNKHRRPVSDTVGEGGAESGDDSEPRLSDTARLVLAQLDELGVVQESRVAVWSLVRDDLQQPGVTGQAHGQGPAVAGLHLLGRSHLCMDMGGI